MSPRTVLVGLVGGATLVASTYVGLVAVGHTPLGRPLLGYLPGFGKSCPIGADLPASVRDDARNTSLAKIAGTAPAEARPAFGFALEATTSDEVRAWATKVGVACQEERQHLRCGEVDDLGGIAADGVRFGFDAQDRLVSVDVTVRTDAARAAGLWADWSDRIAATAGDPHARDASVDATRLADPLDRASTKFRFSDYVADVTATNVGRTVLVRATVQSVS